MYSIHKIIFLPVIILLILNSQSSTESEKSISEMGRLSAQRDSSIPDSGRIEQIDSIKVVLNSPKLDLQIPGKRFNPEPWWAAFKPYIDILSALLTPLIAIIAVYIACQQYQTNKRKLDLDLYNKRSEVYKALTDFIASVLSGKISEKEPISLLDKELIKFQKDTSESYFFFGNDILRYLDEVYEEGLKLRTAYRYLSGKRLKNQEAEKLHAQKDDLLKWFQDQLVISQKKFGRDMRIIRRGFWAKLYDRVKVVLISEGK